MLRSSLFIALTLLTLVAPAYARELKAGDKAPNFQLRDRQQALFHFARFASSKVVVMDFFRTDCKPCIKSLAALKKLQHEMKANKNVRILLIALLEENEGERKLDALLKREKLPFPVIVDTYGSVAKKFIAKENGMRLPSLLVIDKKRRVRWSHHSLLRDTQEIAAIIRKAL